jgi:zinc protease
MKAKPTACVASLAPPPGSELYAPFLVLVSRLWAGADKRGSDGPTGSPVYFTPLDDGAIVAVSAELKPGESGAAGVLRPKLPAILSASGHYR